MVIGLAIIIWPKEYLDIYWMIGFLYKKAFAGAWSACLGVSMGTGIPCNTPISINQYHESRVMLFLVEKSHISPLSTSSSSSLRENLATVIANVRSTSSPVLIRVATTQRVITGMYIHSIPISPAQRPWGWESTPEWGGLPSRKRDFAGFKAPKRSPNIIINIITPTN